MIGLALLVWQLAGPVSSFPATVTEVGRRDDATLQQALDAPPPTAAPEAAAPPAQNPFFELDDLAVRPFDWRRIRIGGRADVTFGRFENKENVDRYDRSFLHTLSPALSAFWEFYPQYNIVIELELDGKEGLVELDQLYVAREIPAANGALKLGLDYIPFGIERRFYSPATNPLVDRPSPFRRIFPGSYSDVGVFLRGGGPLGALREVRGELAVTRGLRGPERDDRPDNLLQSSDDLQFAGRLAVKPLPSIELGASGLLTWFESGELHNRLDLGGLDVLWQRDLFHVRAEVVTGHVEQLPAAGGDFSRHGWYVEMLRRVPFHLPALHAIEAVIRYDELDANSQVRDFLDVRRVALGLNWVILENLRLKSETLLSWERGNDITNDGFFLQLEYHFSSR